MGESDTPEFLRNADDIVERLEQWADDHVNSGQPLSKKGEKSLENVQRLLTELRQRLESMKLEPPE